MYSKTFTKIKANYMFIKIMITYIKEHTDV